MGRIQHIIKGLVCQEKRILKDFFLKPSPVEPDRKRKLFYVENRKPKTIGPVVVSPIGRAVVMKWGEEGNKGNGHENITIFESCYGSFLIM